MMTLVIFALVAVAVTVVLQNSAKSKHKTTMRIESEMAARAALDLMARDIRTAGYGADRDAVPPQPAIAYVDSQEIILSQNQYPYPEPNPLGPVAPLAYDPTANPKPFPLVGTTFTPPMRYRTGAELIRYTLDVNNDGVVNAGDISAPQGADAAATVNPNDYVLVRQVYGDSTNNVDNDNGGVTERVALIRKPGGSGVPPLFNVYMRGIDTPWDWSLGPVPATKLKDIHRIELRVTATASRPDAKGQYPQTTIKSEVNAARSVPDFGTATFPVSGYVFNDLDGDHVRDVGEPGIDNSTVRMGTLVGYTNGTGFYQLRALPGPYVLKHTPAMGYSSAMSPDEFSVTVTDAAIIQDFADSARSGGNVVVNAYNDANENGSLDTGEQPLQGVRINITPGTPEASSGVTNSYGMVTLFTTVGSYTITCVAPDSMVVTNTNPQSGTMPNGGTQSHAFFLARADMGQISGRVYVDVDRDGVMDGTEVGLADVWVGATRDGGATTSGYAYTDASGNYQMNVPVNDPPRTQAYSVWVQPPAGYFPTGASSLGGIWVQASPATVTNKNFGMANFQVITLTANRVLSLTSTDLIEVDWNGKKTNEARTDVDLVLGADAGSTDNVSVWFNLYSNSPLFANNPNNAQGYSRLAPNSVLAMAVDTLDQNDNTLRPDLVTGTRFSAAGNFFVWFTQGSNNNEGYLPSGYSPSQNYTTSNAGDVTAVVTMDVGGSSHPDIIVGTKSPTPGQGSIEVWLNDGATTPAFSRDETINLAYSSFLGEITGMALSDMDNDGDKDLIVSARTSDYNGQMFVFENAGRSAGSRFIARYGVSFGGNSPTAVACLDADGDGWKEIFVGTQRSSSQGLVYQFKNTGLSTLWSYTIPRAVNVPGFVMSMNAGDFGGNASRTDLAVGYHTSTVGYGGGLVIYFMDTGLIPNSGVDPSGGTIVNMVPALTSANFNYGLFTATPPSPYLTDLAAGVKSSATTGALVVFIR